MRVDMADVALVVFVLATLILAAGTLGVIVRIFSIAAGWE